MTERAYLSKTLVDQAEPRANGRDRFIWDTNATTNAKGEPRKRPTTDAVTGFCLRIRPWGRKTWEYQYRAGGRARRVKVGEYPGLPLAEARAKARAWRKRDADPIRERQAEAEAIREAERAKADERTVAELAAEYLERYAKPHKRTWAADDKRIERHVLPALGSLPVVEVKRSHVRELYERLGLESGGREAEHVRVLLSGMFRLASEWEYLDGANPAKIPTRDRFKARRRKRTLRRTELAGLRKALDAVERDGKVEVAVRDARHAVALGVGKTRAGKSVTVEVDRTVVALVRVLLQTGLRSSEVRERRWEDFDREGRTLYLGKTKAGEARTVQLSSAAVEVLKGVPRVVGSGWIFPSPTVHADNPEERLDAPIAQDWTIKQWRRIATAAGIPDVRLHDLRHHVLTELANAGVPAQDLQRIAGHQAIQTTMGYVHAADVGARTALDTLAESVK